MKVGVAGCGRMGLPMARALRRARIDTLGFDLRKDGDFLDLPMVFDPAVFMDGVTALITVVRDEAQTEALLFTDQKLIERASALDLLIVSSTLTPAYMRDLPSRLPDDLQVIDAPAIGDPISAENARLTFLVGGKPDDPDETDLLLSAMGETFYNMGPLGGGMTACLLANLVTASSIASVRTALETAHQNNLDPHLLLDCLNGSAAQNWFSSNFDDLDFSRAATEPDNLLGNLAREVAVASDMLSPPQGHQMGHAVAARLRSLNTLNTPIRSRRNE